MPLLPQCGQYAVLHVQHIVHINSAPRKLQGFQKQGRVTERAFVWNVVEWQRELVHVPSPLTSQPEDGEQNRHTSQDAQRGMNVSVLEDSEGAASTGGV